VGLVAIIIGPMRLHAARFVALALALLFSAAVGGQALPEVTRLLREGHPAEALAAAEARIASNPNEPLARFLKGVARADLGREDEAIAVYRALNDEYPELPEPYNNLGVIYAARGELEKARAALEVALVANPDYATAHENLGDVYLALAVRAWERAARLDRTLRGAPRKLAAARELMNPTKGKP
jgi:tetratricopeptide (TPR) repeat protein